MVRVERGALGAAGVGNRTAGVGLGRCYYNPAIGSFTSCAEPDRHVWVSRHNFRDSPEDNVPAKIREPAGSRGFGDSAKISPRIEEMATHVGE